MNPEPHVSAPPAPGLGGLLVCGTPRWQASGPSSSAEALPADLPHALLITLALHEGWVSRERLQGLLWPDAPPKQAQHNLRVNLHRLRRLLATRGLADQGLQVQAGAVRCALDSDLARFRRALAGGDTGAAVAALEPPLLDGYAPRGFDSVVQWWDGQRSSVAEQWQQASLRQAARLAGEDPTAAHELLLRVLRVDPLAEAAVQALLELAPRSGRRVEALLQYERLHQRLADDLGVEPVAPTRQQAEALRAWIEQPDGADPGASAATIPPQPGAAAPRVWPVRHAGPGAHGGDAWPWVETQATRAVPARGLTLLTGEPGAGKTSAARHACDSGSLWLHCHEGDDEPLAPLARWLRVHPEAIPASSGWTAARRGLSRWVTPLVAHHHEAATRRDQRLLMWLAQLLALHDTVVVDDLQWADTATLSVLRRLLHGHPGAQVVATWRETEGPAALQRWVLTLSGAVPVRRVPVLAWTEPQVATLLDRLGADGSTRATLVPWLHRQTGGNPLFLRETLVALAAQGRLQAGDGGWTWPAPAAGDDAPVTPELAAQVLRRVDVLGGPAREVLSLAAVCGDAENLESMAALLDLSAWQVARVISLAQRAGLLTQRRFAHDLVRQALEEALPEAERGLLHAGIARAFEHRWPPHRLASHWWLAGASHAASAVAATLAACAQDRSHGLLEAAAERAETAWQRLADAEASRADLRAQLALDCALSAYERGQSDLAEAWLAKADPLATLPATRGQLLLLRAELALHVGKVHRAEALTRDAAGTAPALPRVLGLQARLAHLRGRYDEAAAIYRHLLQNQRRHRPGVGLVDALTSLGAVLDAAGDPAAGLPHHVEAWQVAARLGARALQVRVALNLVGCLRQLGRHGEAITWAERGLALGHFDTTDSLRNNLAAALLADGRVDEARQHSLEISAHENPTLRTLALARLVRIDAQIGDPAALMQHLEPLMATLPKTEQYLPRAAAIGSVLEHAPTEWHARVLRYLSDEPLPAEVQNWLAGLLAARGITGAAHPSPTPANASPGSAAAQPEASLPAAG